MHCIVEQVTPQGQSVDVSQVTTSGGVGVGGINVGSVDVDNYAIIPSNVLFSELVRTALGKLGYSSSEALAAKGNIIESYYFLKFSRIITKSYLVFEIKTFAF